MSLSMNPETVAAFQKEWEPLYSSLTPIEHLGNGLFACIHQAGIADPKPILLWDVSIDLAEQTMIELSTNLNDYEQYRLSCENPAEESAFEMRRRKRKAEAELFSVMEQFNQFSEWFQQGYQEKTATADTDGQDVLEESAFEHDKLNRLPRYDAWKPERFCVHDCLMGVMGYRFNRMIGRLEVTGYATRDHTNYARGSATRSLLLCLLCEWAKQSAHLGIVFVNDWRQPEPNPVAVPHEISVYGRVLGVDIQPGANELPYLICKALFLKLTPFSPRARSALEKTDLSIKACLMAHKGIWSISQIEDMVRYCPMAQEIFDGGVQPEEQIRMAIAMEHAKLAVMSGIAEQMVRVQAEEKQASVKVHDIEGWLAMMTGMEECRLVSSVKVHDIESKLADWAYSRLFTCDCDILLTCLEKGRRIEQILTAGALFAIFSWPVTEQLFHRRDTVFRTLEKTTLEKHLDAVFLMVPENAALNQLPDVPDIPGIHLALMHESLDVIQQTAWRNIRQAGRLRK